MMHTRYLSILMDGMISVWTHQRGKAMAGITFLYSSSSASRPANSSLSKASSDISFALPPFSLFDISVGSDSVDRENGVWSFGCDGCEGVVMRW